MKSPRWQRTMAPGWRIQVKPLPFSPSWMQVKFDFEAEAKGTTNSRDGHHLIASVFFVR